MPEKPASNTNSASALVIVSDDQLPADQRIWGTGGWVVTNERDALDWLTLLCLCGWQTRVTRPDALDAAPQATWIIVAGDLTRVSADTVRWLAARLANERVLVIARAARPGSALANLAGVADDVETFASLD